MRSTSTLAAACIIALALAVIAPQAHLSQAPAIVGIGMGIGILCAIAVAFRSGSQRVQGTGSFTSRPHNAPTPARSDAWDLARDFLIATGQGLVVVVIVVVAVAGPALAIYYGTELSSIIVFTSWQHPRLVHGPDSQYLVVARLLQLFLLVLVSLIPALMYFQFDREKLTTLVDRWLHAIFRLDPSLKTVADVDAKYGRRVEEFYGATLALGATAIRKRWRDRSPVIVATLLIALGWILVLLNNQHDAAGLPTFQDLFQPSHTPMTLAFLGAYFLSVQVALRGYVRGDLKPKTYNVITVRILMALVLAWVMQVLWGTTKLTLGASFLAGIVPSTVLQWIRESIGQVKTSAQNVTSRVLQSSTQAGSSGSDGSDGSEDDDELGNKSPLSRLDDIDIYDRTRLEEEGITSIQALARHDLIDLMLSSRIPVPRLVDWVDQAILHQHAPQAMVTLRRLGVRTATDYLQVYDDAGALAELKSALDAQHIALGVELLRSVLKNDEWVRYLQNWREDDGSVPRPTLTYNQNGRVDDAIVVHAAAPTDGPITAWFGLVARRPARTRVATRTGAVNGDRRT